MDILYIHRFIYFRRLCGQRRCKKNLSSQDKKVEESNTKTDIKPSVKKDISEPEIVEVDWSKYFNDLNGAAVFYDVSEKKHMIYNKELAFTQNSPCSTFKIVSSLIALEKGMIQPDDSVHTWSGEIFWNEQWNRDINFEEAFKTSCVWYFREVIDEIGKETIQEQLNKLQYGNCDISDWEGYLNTNNNNRTLTGFWIESSLKISPKEQVEVMKRIFGEHSVYSKSAQDELKKVMLVTEESQTDVYIYGKTGMGKVQGILADAWFTGFAEYEGRKIYFCVYLGKNEDKNVSSSVAKEIAIQMIHDYCTEK
ncbi:MAG: class D beta-lactamase [Lachnospiraceae bacterium]|nr:class D beta-lactamase [Lachnospiraceae bacterium]